jgi:hypothetical protein
MNKLNKENIDEIISTFGKRETPDAQMMQKAQDNVFAYWQKSVKKQKTQRNRLTLMRMAASFALVVGVLFITKVYFMPNAEPIATIGHSIYAQNDVQVSDDGINWQSLSLGSTLKSQQWVKTPSDGLMSFTLEDGSQIRLNSATLLHITNSSEFELIEGELYHDADTNNASKLTINTNLGTIEHIGTRYAVEIHQANLTVKVRNGLVKLSSDALSTTLKKGAILALNTQGKIQKSSLTAYDAQWSWTVNAIKKVDISDKSLAEFVNWYAHENGLTVNWNKQKYKAGDVVLSGDFMRLNNEQLLKTVFLSTKFDFRINQGILTLNP